MGSEAARLHDYIVDVWGGCPLDDYLEVSSRVAGAVRGGGWSSQHVRIGDLIAGGERGVSGLLTAARTGGLDLYFGCMPLSEVPESGRGKGGLRTVVPGIWFDVDAMAPGREVSAKGDLPLFETAEDALDALDTFLAESGLELSLATDSGWGLHGWLLFESVGRAETIELVRHWNLTFARWARERYGVHVDVVADKTRVLRVPGTINWRGADSVEDAVGVRVVRGGGGSRRYSLDELGWEAVERAKVEREGILRRRRVLGREEREQDCALFDARCALDACSWAEILERFGWVPLPVEGVGESERWGRPRDAGRGRGERGESGVTSSAVVFTDAPWVLVVFSEAAGLPSWAEVREEGRKPNTKWRTWVRLAYEGDEMAALADAVGVGLHGFPRKWPKSAATILKADGDIYRALDLSLGGNVRNKGVSMLAAAAL